MREIIDFFFYVLIEVSVLLANKRDKVKKKTSFVILLLTKFFTILVTCLKAKEPH